MLEELPCISLSPGRESASNAAGVARFIRYTCTNDILFGDASCSRSSHVRSLVHLRTASLGSRVVTSIAATRAVPRGLPITLRGGKKMKRGGDRERSEKFETVRPLPIPSRSLISDLLRRLPLLKFFSWVPSPFVTVFSAKFVDTGISLELGDAVADGVWWRQ